MSPYGEILAYDIISTGGANCTNFNDRRIVQKVLQLKKEGRVRRKYRQNWYRRCGTQRGHDEVFDSCVTRIKHNDHHQIAPSV
jgi:hypothetical protein